MAPSKPHRKRPDNAHRSQLADVLPQASDSHILAVYLHALLVRQWTKSLIVFTAPLFAFNFTPAFLSGSLLAFILFCFASGSFYLINNIMDVESDQRHPVKCKQPIAAGLISIPVSILMTVLLLGSSLITGWWHAPILGTAILGYALLQVAHNLRLKHKVIVDVIAIATEFILRAWGVLVQQILSYLTGFCITERTVLL